MLILTIVEGTGEIELDGVRRLIKTGDVINLAVGTVYSIKANSDIRMIEVKVGVD